MKTPILLLLAALPGCSICQSRSANPYATVGVIPLPAGCHRLPAGQNSFAVWLRATPLKKDRTVYLYDGTPKRYQGAQFAVLDISVGHTDLQQCADAVMRLRAEYLFANRDWDAICFYTEQGHRLNFSEWAHRRPDSATRKSFDAYLIKVFTYCSTRTLEKQLVPKSIGSINPGDVLIKGGAPGHAMTVIDVAQDAQGRRIFLLAQSYMPAQDIHIVNNPADPAISPWFRADGAETLLETPEWTFTTNQLRMWPTGIAEH
jgi:hypothetical protein